MGAIPEFLRSRLACLRGRYTLPGVPGDQHWIPQSGGADSAALAIVLTTLFPDVPFKLIFTDTGVDEAGCYEVLDKVEAYTGIEIVRISAERNLYELIEDYGGFLPSPLARYCTRELKTEPFAKFMQAARQGEERIHAHVGIRADESTRLAFSSPEIDTHLPFIDMDLRRGDIMQILGETIGVPAYYRRRTRSGCATCFFQRRTEVIGLLQEQPVEFARGERCEKVAPVHLARHAPAPSLPTEVGLTENHLCYPVPEDIDAPEEAVRPLQGRAPRHESLPLFGAAHPTTTLYAAYELFYRPETGVWWRRFVSFSRSLPGIKKQLDAHWVHRLMTAEAHFLSQDEMRDELRLVVACIEMPADRVDAARLPAGGDEPTYTWSDGESYAQIRHLTGWAVRSLYAAGLRQEIARYERWREKPCSWGYEQLVSTEAALAKITEPVGDVVHLARYIPSVSDEEDLEQDERSVPCPMCTLGL